MASSARTQQRMVPAIVVLAALLSPAARADDERPFEIGTKPVWYVLAGATTGDTLVARDGAYYLGGDVSVVRLGRAGRFLGFYGDGYYDFGSSRTNATAGIELGYRFVSGRGRSCAVRRRSCRVGCCRAAVRWRRHCHPLRTIPFQSVGYGMKLEINGTTIEVAVPAETPLLWVIRAAPAPYTSTVKHAARASSR